MRAAAEGLAADQRALPALRGVHLLLTLADYCDFTSI